MNKLVIALSVAALAAATQAASVKWNSGTVKAATAATGAVGTANATSYTAYLYTFATLDAYNEAKATDVAKLYNDYVVGGVGAALTATAKPNGQANITQTGLADGSSDSPVTVYGMVLYVDTATAASYDGIDAFVKAGFASDTYQDTAGLTFGGLGLQTTNWTAAPEPTSGLLLMLGVAGLALKRKRA